MNSDEALMLEFQQGSRAAFEELYERYQGPLYGFFRRRLERPERAEDLAQETFLVVIRRASRYEPRALVRTYLYAIALKLLANERRKPPDVSSDESPVEPESLPVQETAIWLREALGRLNPSGREILMLREYEQLSYAEIGELLRLPLNTVRTRLFRAREALRGELQSRRSATPLPGGAAANPANAAGEEA
jgi:RNA polymerase sigma-70 factor (ECF subfamily)